MSDLKELIKSQILDTVCSRPNSLRHLLALALLGRCNLLELLRVLLPEWDICKLVTQKLCRNHCWLLIVSRLAYRWINLCVVAE